MKLNKIPLWKEYVKVFEYGGPVPYYTQWVVWCWRRPIYIGLPLAILTPVLIVIDVLLGMLWIFTRWGRKSGVVE